MRVWFAKIVTVVLVLIASAVLWPSTQAREGELVCPGSSQPQRLRLSQIREDLRRIQRLNREKIRPALTTNTFDYKNLARALSEIERRAVRLKTNLALPDSVEQTESNDSNAPNYLSELKRLDELIRSFVFNPFFRDTGTIDVQSTAKASRALQEIIQISGWLKRKHR